MRSDGWRESIITDALPAFVTANIATGFHLDFLKYNGTIVF